MTPNTAWSPYPVGRVPARTLGERAFHAAIVEFKPSLGDYEKRLRSARLVPCCGCGAQLAGHDPGDEDRKAP